MVTEQLPSTAGMAASAGAGPGSEEVAAIGRAMTSPVLWT